MRRESITRRVSNMIILFFFVRSLERKENVPHASAASSPSQKYPFPSPPTPFFPPQSPFQSRSEGLKKRSCGSSFFLFPFLLSDQSSSPFSRPGHKKERDEADPIPSFLPSLFSVAVARVINRSHKTDQSRKEREKREEEFRDIFGRENSVLQTQAQRNNIAKRMGRGRMINLLWRPRKNVFPFSFYSFAKPLNGEIPAFFFFSHLWGIGKGRGEMHPEKLGRF